MKKKLQIVCVGLITLNLQLITHHSFSQNVGVNDNGAAPNANAILDVDASTNDKGLLIPRITTTQRTGISGLGAGDEGLTVYDETTTSFWFWNGTQWTEMLNSGAGWTLSGNVGTTNGTHFIGTTDAQSIDIRTNNVIRVRVTQKGQIEVLNTGNSVFVGEGAGANDDLSSNLNTFIGYNAGNVNTTGSHNTGIGHTALVANTTGYRNTAVGIGALQSNTTGFYNTAVSMGALVANTTGSNNSAVGRDALAQNTSGVNNTAMGRSTLGRNTTGYSNVAVGISALERNTTTSNLVAVGDSALFWNTGIENVAVGSKALFSNTTGIWNTGMGYNAIYSNTTGAGNTAFGNQALYANTSGANNTAIGRGALIANTVGASNTAIGNAGVLQANTSGNDNVAIGSLALNRNTTGNYNIGVGNWSGQLNTAANGNTAVGYVALRFHDNGGGGDYNTALGFGAYNSGGTTNYTNSTAIGYNAQINASNKVRLGSTTVGVIEGQVAYTFPSDGRFKFNIREEVKGLDFIMKLRPVVYQFNTQKFDEFLRKESPDDMTSEITKNIDYTESMNITHTGFIAQEVEAAAKACQFNFDGVNIPENEDGNYGVAYSQFVVPLVKAVQEQQQIIKKLEMENEGLKNEMKRKDQQMDLRVKLLEEHLKTVNK